MHVRPLAWACMDAEPGSEAYKALAVMQKLEEYDKALAMYEAAWEKTKEAVRVVEGLARSWLEVPFGQLRQPDVAQRCVVCSVFAWVPVHAHVRNTINCSRMMEVSLACG